MPEKQSQMRSSQKVKHKVAGSIPRFTVYNPAIVIVIVCTMCLFGACAFSLQSGRFNDWYLYNLHFRNIAHGGQY